MPTASAYPELRAEQRRYEALAAEIDRVRAIDARLAAGRELARGADAAWRRMADSNGRLGTIVAGALLAHAQAEAAT